VWVANAIDDTLARMDISDGHVQTVAVDARPSGVAFTPEGVWVTSSAGSTVACVDPRSLDVELTANVGSEPTAVLAASGSIWITNHIDGTVTRMDPHSGSVIATVPVGDGPNSLASASGSIWVADEFDETVTVLSPGGNDVDRTVSLGAGLASITADGDRVWLSVGASTSSHRGGTLRVAAADPLQTLDPARSYDLRAWGVLTVTNDGLMGFKKAGGAEGSTLLPDLAAALPEVSSDGLSYRFELRPGIRYSTGALVQPQDFRTGLERAGALSPDAASIFGSIAGMKACHHDPATCDLSDDIVVDDGSVTFHLARPDPDLPFKLALPFADPVPSGTPVEDQRWNAVPATGPYLVERADDTGLVLVRNPAFEVWSPAVQPDGFVDRIEWTYGVDQDAAAEQLSSGALDWAADGLTPDAIEELRAVHPDLVVSTPTASTLYIGFDLTTPPFDDPLVRQALNFAVDRAHVVDLIGGPASNHVTCQILPPNFQGYIPYCPYTSDPGSGKWTAPDVDRARELIARSGAAGMNVQVWASDVSFLPGALTVPTYVVSVLDDLGVSTRSGI
jgi:peptide/nickel transport system substrate-binding protein